MININRVLPLLLILISATLIGCGQQKQVVIVKTDEPLDTAAREIKNFSTDWVKMLEGLSYRYSTSSDEKIVALVFKQSDKWFYKEYSVKNGETLPFDADMGQLMYVSLPANRTIAYSWRMLESENLMDSKGTDYTEWLTIPFDNENNAEGENYDRQVFDLSSSEKQPPLKFQYKHNSENSDDVFEFLIENR